MNKMNDIQLKLVLYKTALQAIIAREGILAVHSKEAVAKQAMEYAEKALKEWKNKLYEQSVL